MKTSNDRRKFLLQSFTALGTAFTLSPVSRAFAQSCRIVTPPQTQGPFYPEGDFSTNTDLTRVPGRNGRAKGKVVVIEGIVQDEHCKPIAGANVEIWQASESGRYQHSQDPNPAALDPNFKYWAETFTDQNGKYSFRTIIPGAYPAEEGWIRPPHVHFRVAHVRYKELVTQMYFAGHELNSKDQILQDLSQIEQDSVIVDFSKKIPGDLDHALIGKFSITLKK